MASLRQKGNLGYTGSVEAAHPQQRIMRFCLSAMKPFGK